MKLALLVCLVSLNSACVTQVDAGRSESTDDQLGPTSVNIDIHAPSLADHESTEIIVYLPASYAIDVSRAYPVVFFLHGWGADASAFELRGGAKELANLPDDKSMVVVSVSGETSGYQNWADGRSLWEDHLLGAVLDRITSDFRVSTSREHRALYGASMGGAAALRIAMSRSDMFACVAAHAAAIDSIDFEKLPESRRASFLEMEDFADRYGDPFNAHLWESTNPLYLALNSDVENLRSVRYYFDVGVDDELGFADDNAALSQLFSRRGIPHIFALRVGGHGRTFVESNIHHAMSFLSSCLTSVENSKTSH